MSGTSAPNQQPPTSTVISVTTSPSITTTALFTPTTTLSTTTQPANETPITVATATSIDSRTPTVSPTGTSVITPAVTPARTGSPTTDTPTNTPIGTPVGDSAIVNRVPNRETSSMVSMFSLLHDNGIQMCLKTCLKKQPIPSSCAELESALTQDECRKSCSIDRISLISKAFNCDVPIKTPTSTPPTPTSTPPTPRQEASPTSPARTDRQWPGVDAQKRLDALVRTDGAVRKCTKECRRYDQPTNCDEARRLLSPGGCGESCSAKSVFKLMHALHCPAPNPAVSCKNLNLNTSIECAGQYADSRIVSDEDFPYGCLSVKTKRGTSVYFNDANRDASQFSLAYQCDSLIT